jgi:hypothetical protein
MMQLLKKESILNLANVPSRRDKAKKSDFCDSFHIMLHQLASRKGS